MMVANQKQAIVEKGDWKVILTPGLGNIGGAFQDFSSTTSRLTYFAARWDGDKIRGIRMTLADGTDQKWGGFDDKYTLTSCTFSPGETLSKFWLRDSTFGYGSIRQIEFETSLNQRFYAGGDGFDNELSINVYGRYWAGVRGWINQDNFINAMALYVTT